MQRNATRIISAWYDNDQKGHLQVWKWDGTAWVVVCDDMVSDPGTSDGGGDHYGAKGVSISSGSAPYVGGGAQYYDLPGTPVLSNGGQVIIYKLDPC